MQADIGAMLDHMGFCTQIANPQWPLEFETLGGSEAVEGLGGWGFPSDFIRMEASTVVGFAGGFASRQAYEATLAALEAHSAHGAAARAGARKALPICSTCPEAHVVLALNGGSQEEVLAHFVKAEELGPLVLAPERQERALASTDIWREAPPVRSYLRGAGEAGAVGAPLQGPGLRQHIHQWACPPARAVVSRARPGRGGAPHARAPCEQRLLHLPHLGALLDPHLCSLPFCHGAVHHVPPHHDRLQG